MPGLGFRVYGFGVLDLWLWVRVLGFRELPPKGFSPDL